MSEPHPTTPAPSGKPVQPPYNRHAKPAKPYPDYPLTAHPAGYWCKKIRGKIHYFGPWSDPDGALQKYLAERDALHAGRTPRPDAQGLTVKALANAFLNHKKALLDAGELSPRTWDEYKETTDILVSQFGKGRLVEDLGPDDFAALRKKLAKRWGPTRLRNVIQRVRSVFKYAADSDLVARVVRYGQGFQRPSQKTLRLNRARQGTKLFTAAEIRAMAEGALVVGPDGPKLVEPAPQLKAMILLGINCGFGNADCGTLPVSALDLERGWIDYPRPKTGIPRRCPLWPETLAAVKEALAVRPKPRKPEFARLVFVTMRGLSWAKDTRDNPVTKETAKLLHAVGINGRKGIGFYALRHSFRTIADESKDQPAVDFIMGHEVPHMSVVYRETISDARLKAVTDYIRGWLFGATDPVQ
jgi:integrase